MSDGKRSTTSPDKAAPKRAKRGLPEKLVALEERVARLEQYLKLPKVPAPPAEPVKPSGPQCPGCRLRVKNLRGRCPWCGMVFNAVVARRQK